MPKIQKPKARDDQPSLFDDPDDLPLCQHVSGVRAWSLVTDPASAYCGLWVHADPACRRPAHLNRQELPWLR